MRSIAKPCTATAEAPACGMPHCNKRTGLLAGIVFLSLNGYGFDADEADIVTTIESLAAGNTEIATLAGWFARCSAPGP